MSKFQNLAKLGNNLLKSNSLTNVGNIKARLKFLIPNTIIAFNYL